MLPVAGLMVILVFAAALPWRMADAVRHASLDNATLGLSLWQHEPDGSRYRWAGGRSTFFVTSGARAIRIPLVAGNDAPGTMVVRVFLDGREADRVELPPDGQWRVVRLIPERTSADFYRIDMVAERAETGAVLDTVPSNTGGLFKVGGARIDFEKPGRYPPRQ